MATIVSPDTIFELGDMESTPSRSHRTSRTKSDLEDDVVINRIGRPAELNVGGIIHCYTNYSD